MDPFTLLEDFLLNDHKSHPQPNSLPFMGQLERKIFIWNNEIQSQCSPLISVDMVSCPVPSADHRTIVPKLHCL